MSISYLERLYVVSWSQIRFMIVSNHVKRFRLIIVHQNCEVRWCLGLGQNLNFQNTVATFVFWETKCAQKLEITLQVISWFGQRLSIETQYIYIYNKYIDNPNPQQLTATNWTKPTTHHCVARYLLPVRRSVEFRSDVWRMRSWRMCCRICSLA